MFKKIKNAQMQEPEYGEWGISRGHVNHGPHRAAFVSVDHGMVGTKFLAHYLYAANASDLSFKQFVRRIKARHGENLSNVNQV